MEDNHEIKNIKHFDISQDQNIIINIAKNLEEEIINNNELKDDNLYYYFFCKEIYNEKGTKLLDNEKYIKLMTILNKYLKEEKYFIFLYFKKRNIDLIKIVINGYITSDIKDSNQKEILLKTIKDIICIFFTKNLFYIVYNKLSKIFRRFNSIEDKEMLFNKFSKIFDIWNLLFDIYEDSKYNSNYIAFIGNQILTLVNDKNDFKFNNVDIYIEFDELIDNNYDFSLVEIQYTNNEINIMKFGDILKEEVKEKIKNIFIKIDRESIGYLFNNELGLEENNNKDLVKFKDINPASDFTKIEILKNYIGKIKCIKIKIEYKDEKSPKEEYEILPSEDEQGYDIIPSMEKENNIIELSFKNKPICCGIYKEYLYEDMRYYGGLENFIPILKIIKYFFSSFKENTDKINLLNNMILNIFKTIIKLICYSENNFMNFVKILSSLIAALAEINHIFPNNLKNDFYSNYIFSLLYILISNSQIPFALKKTYSLVTGLTNFDKLNLNLDELIIDIEKMNITSYQWYISLIIKGIELILLKYNDINLIPKKLIEQLIYIKNTVEKKDTKLFSLISNSLNILNYICTVGDEENNIFPKCEKIEDVQTYFKDNIINNPDNLMSILNMIQIYFTSVNFDTYAIQLDEEKEDIKELNIKKGEKEKDIFKDKFKNLFNIFEKIPLENNEEIQNLVKNAFEEYIFNKDYLTKIFPFLKNNNNFKLEQEILLMEFTDFHKNYHNLMKNIFIFNKFWSDKKLFFTEKKRKNYLKYKSINYYTTNYQRPLIFPVLDYKNLYPNFTKFKIEKDFYTSEENPDEYNFKLDCPELDTYNIKYEEILFHHIKSKSMMNIFDVCLVKKTHHIKGRLMVCVDKSLLLKKILFISYPSKIEKQIPCCNVLQENPNYNNKKEKLCYGAIFVCPEKYMNIKIFIDVKNIRMILRRIYFYKKSAVEIFTTNKSYFLNFADDTTNYKSTICEVKCDDFTNMFAYFISVFFPIKIGKVIIGHSRQFEEMLTIYKDVDKLKKYDIDIGNKFMFALFGHWIGNMDGIKLSTLDLLIYLNFFSNRSYSDLFQYPVFPLFFFYDKKKDNTYTRLERKLNLHIGFQEISDKAKQRKRLIKQTYQDSLNEVEENEGYDCEIPSYFKTHYSTHFYICNFLLRIFPFSFMAIELQGNGFDAPNRLFFSIEDTLFNISYNKSDLRELIPEFYYLPEMFTNINRIDFHKRTNGMPVDDVEMPKDLAKIDKDKSISTRISGGSIDYNDDYQKSDYFCSFKFVEKLRNILEAKSTDIISWINIIFGSGQKYKSQKDKDLLFRNESYIYYYEDKNSTFKKYRKDKTFMTSVEFGMTPIQTVFEENIGKVKNRVNYYDIKPKDDKDKFKNFCNPFIERIKKEKDLLAQNKNNNEINKFDSNSTYKIIFPNNNIPKVKKIKINKSQINKIFSNPETNINCYFENNDHKIIGYKTGKVEIYLKSEEKGKFELISNFFDHNDEIIHINYNKRLNMMCSSSKDGFLNIYILPNKLITTLKNPNEGNCFSFSFLSSNPFPSIIAFDKENLEFFSYSINGFKIKRVKLNDILELNDTKKNDTWICANFNEEGGHYKDRLIFIEYIKKEKEKDCLYKCQFIKVPFFDKEEKGIDIKSK